MNEGLKPFLSEETSEPLIDLLSYNQFAATILSGLREVVENWDASRPTGIHMNGWDPKDVAWGVDMALDDPERLKQWGRNARERCTNDFIWRKAAERTLEIYHEVLAKLGGITA